MLWRSVPQLGTPWRALVMAALASMALPAALGLVLMGVFYLIGANLPGDQGLFLIGAGLMLTYSPLVSFAGMMLAVPLVSLLIRAGWFGWLPAAATGLGVGAILGAMADIALGAPFGLCALLILRAFLARLQPGIV